MNDLLLRLAITVAHPHASGATGHLRSRLHRSSRAATFVEYAILALMAIVVGAVIVQLMTGAITNIFDRLTKYLAGSGQSG